MSIRVRITDDEVLQNVNRNNVIAHLKRTGWEHGATGQWSDWFYKDDHEVQLPIQTVLDYKYRIYELFQVLEEVEDRSQLDIWEDLK